MTYSSAVSRGLKPEDRALRREVGRRRSRLLNDKPAGGMKQALHHNSHYAVFRDMLMVSLNKIVCIFCSCLDLEIRVPF